MFNATGEKKMNTKHQPATPLPHKYGAGTRLSSAYTAGLNGQPCAKHYGGIGSAATKAWLAGRGEREKSERAEKERRATAYPKLVAALREAIDNMEDFGGDDGRSAAQAILRELGE